MPSVPWDDPRCILCLEAKPLTKAHLIPEFLGGNLFAYNECSDCNSRLGSKVEAAIREAPQIRLAAINLRDQLPDLEQRINDGQRYIAKQEDGTVVRFARKGQEFRMLNHSEPGNRILDDASAMKSVRAVLIRAGRTPEDADAIVAEIEKAPRDTIIQIDENTAIRRSAISHEKIVYRGDGDLFEDRAAGADRLPLLGAQVSRASTPAGVRRTPGMASRRGASARVLPGRRQATPVPAGPCSNDAAFRGRHRDSRLPAGVAGASSDSDRSARAPQG